MNGNFVAWVISRNCCLLEGDAEDFVSHWEPHLPRRSVVVPLTLSLAICILEGGVFGQTYWLYPRDQRDIRCWLERSLKLRMWYHRLCDISQASSPVSGLYSVWEEKRKAFNSYL